MNLLNINQNNKLINKQDRNNYINLLKEWNDIYFEKTGHRRLGIVKTYGCQMNEHDSEKMESFLIESGYNLASEKEYADIILINTCLIRENAELKIYGKVGELKRLKRQNPNLIIGISGCMMQKESIRKEIKSKYRHVDLIFGTHNIYDLPKYIYKNIVNKGRVVSIFEDNSEIVENIPSVRKYSHKGLVNITYGCNNFCTYCVVPYTRGREKSRQSDNIINEIKSMSAEGCREITLLGQNVNSYRSSSESKSDFSNLLKRISTINDINRIRFMTSHPKDISSELIDTISEHRNICNHIHLPFQSGSNDILKSMNRRYTREQYLDIISEIKCKIPNIAITTDIIVGFPGETERDFEDTIDLVKEVQFDSAYTFLYSIREGTPASKYEKQVPEEIKSIRFNKLLDIVNSISYEKNLKHIGKVEEVLVDDVSKKNNNILTGRTEGGKLVFFEGGHTDIGKSISIKINDAKIKSLYGVKI